MEESIISQYDELLQWIKDKDRLPNNGPHSGHRERKLSKEYEKIRILYKNQQLCLADIAYFEKIKCWKWYTKNEEILKKQKERMLIWIKKHGSLPDWSDKKTPITENDKENKYLRNLIKHKIERYNKNILDKEEIEFYESLPGWSWNKHNIKWMNTYNLLKSFVEETGEYPRSSGAKEEQNLNRWISTQRGFYKKRELELDRIVLLEAIPNWDWEPQLSQGEMILKDVLSQLGLNAYKQVIVEGCSNVRHLSFDTMILKNGFTPEYLKNSYFLSKKNISEAVKNGLILIEIDGLQHFEPAFKNSESERIVTFINTRINDIIKDEFCKKYKIPLIRIRENEIKNAKNIIKDALLNPEKYIDKREYYRCNLFDTVDIYCKKKNIENPLENCSLEDYCEQNNISSIDKIKKIKSIEITSLVEKAS